MNKLFYFDSNHISIFLIGFLFLVASIVVIEFLKNNTLSLFLLFISGLFLCSFMALLDPFLNTWDEQFHALVAKNLISHPLIPTLYDHPIIPYDYIQWNGNYIWLHKQPLFLWQIALSLRIFGLNEFAVRIPSVIMMSVAPLFIYRIGKISLNERIGFYGALLFASSYFVHELCTGFPPSDHNDIAFLFYITASIWAWVEYEKSQKKYWLILIGLFSGCAVLTKWLAGLLVFSGWSLSIIFDKERRKSFASYKAIGLSLTVCFAVFIPWQLYIMHAFPKESSYEYGLNAKHFFKVVENHGGDALYYFDNLRKVYGEGQLVPFAILFSLFFFYRSISENKFKIAFFSFLILVYSFFSLAATKMIAFCFIVSPFIFLSLAATLEKILSFVKAKLFKKDVYRNFVTTLVLSLLLWANLNLHRIAYKHTMYIKPNDNDKRIAKVYDAAFIKTLKGYLPSDDYVIFNCKPERSISVMFYTPFISYDKTLDYNTYVELKNKKVKLAVIDNGKLPVFLKNDLSVIKIKAPDPTWR
jgi:4-amino-4-deoxy-L-arabinose transferase-like glycosyltransferase